MSRLRGRSQDQENQETCPGTPDVVFPDKHLSVAKARPRLMAGLLALVTLLVYLPVCRCDFLVYDDDDYVTGNPVVQNGLTWAGVKWAFTTWHAGNWHPLTWLSHMADGELFGLNPGAQHLVNALFHSVNVVLLFALMLRLTNSQWPSALVAALFAWHPLHVESVAWISERKDVLSTFFGLLTLLTYARFAQKVTSDRWPATGKETTQAPVWPRVSCHKALFYWLAVIFFALGLLSKPMLVTLPLVMLLLDYWPLKRFSLSAFRLPLLLEKTPFFLLALGSGVVTFLAQQRGEAVVSLAKVSLAYRLENAPVAVVGYLSKIFWPADLAVIYPMPDKIPAIPVVGAIIILIFISIAVWRVRRQCPGLLVGWFWFLGTLMPVIGLVQVGGAAMADRYTYLPATGVFLATAFGLRDLVGRCQSLKNPIAVGCGLMLTGCLLATENQLRYWRDSRTLFAHAVAVTKDNSIAHINLGVALEQQGKLDEALAEYRAAVELAPGRYQVHNNLGNLLDKMGEPDQALAEYREAVRLKPELSALHSGLGSELAELGRFSEALIEFTNAAQLDPANPWPHFEMARAFLKQGQDDEAMNQFREALRIDPDNFRVLAYTAHVLAAAENPRLRDGQTALAFATRANTLTGGAQPLVLDALGMAYAETGDFTHAQAVTEQALDLATAAKLKDLEGVRHRLELYKDRQPWRESFRFTNAPAKSGAME